MGIRTYRGKTVCDKRWPDGTRTTRVCENRTKAKQLLARIDASIADGTWPELKEKLILRDRGNLTLQEFSKTYIEDYAKPRNKKGAWQRNLVSFRALNKLLGRHNLEAITPARLHRYVRARKLKAVTNATINRDLTTLKHLLNYAVECGVLDSNPVKKFKKLDEEERERPRFSDDQIQRVFDAIRADCQPLFVFIRETGCRREEAQSLQHWQVHEESRLVVFSENTKSKKWRYVPLTEAAIDAVRGLPPQEDCPYVFYNLESRTRWAVCRKPWEKAAKRAGIPNLQAKDLRRHFAIRLAENGADMHDIQQALGHSSVGITEKHYAQFSPRHSARRILKVLEGGALRGKKRSA